MVLTTITSLADDVPAAMMMGSNENQSCSFGSPQWFLFRELMCIVLIFVRIVDNMDSDADHGF